MSIIFATCKALVNLIELVY